MCARKQGFSHKRCKREKGETSAFVLLRVEAKYLRLIDFVYHSTLGMRVIQRKKKKKVETKFLSWFPSVVFIGAAGAQTARIEDSFSCDRPWIQVAESGPM